MAWAEGCIRADQHETPEFTAMAPQEMRRDDSAEGTADNDIVLAAEMAHHPGDVVAEIGFGMKRII